jgi:phospholipase C
MPKADPGEGYENTMTQLYGHPADMKNGPFNQGFVNDWAFSYKNIDEKYFKEKDGVPPAYPGIANKDIMGMFTPDLLPVMSGLAKGFAVCDHWYCSIPTETIPNRSFIHMATSQGVLKDTVELKQPDGTTKKGQFQYTAPTIYTELTKKGVSWGMYGYNQPPLARSTITELQNAKNHHFGDYSHFKKHLDSKKLPAYSFLEPEWGVKGNSMHPNYNVAAGEEFLLEVYNDLKQSAHWEDTLLIVNFDEHGGCYDHVLPPSNAAQPNAESVNAATGFDFTRFGVRIPAILISPWIPAGSVFRAPASGAPIDHTSVLATLEEKYGIEPLTERDKAAPHLGGALSLDKVRTDDPMAGVKAPQYTPPTEPAGADRPGHIQTMHRGYLDQMHASKGSSMTVNDDDWFKKSSKEADDYISKSYHSYYHENQFQND